MALTIDPLAILTNAIKSANEIGVKIQAAKSDRTEQIKAIIETSDDDSIVKFRENRAKALAQIEAIKAQIENATAKVQEKAETLVQSVDADFDVEKATKEFIAARKSATDARKAILSFGIISEEDLDAALAENGVAEIVSLRGVKGSGGSRGSQPGVKRPRISAATFDGEKVVGKDDKVDFTTLAKKDSEVTAQILKEAAFKAAETEDLNSLQAGTVISFMVNGHKYTVTVSGEKPGRKPAEKTE